MSEWRADTPSGPSWHASEADAMAYADALVRGGEKAVVVWEEGPA